MAKVHVVGLGPGDLSGLPMGTYTLLKTGLPVILRTTIHPVVEALQKEGMTFRSFDEFYETGEDFAAIYQGMAKRLADLAQEVGELIYAVPGHPLMAEQSVQNLYAYQNVIDIEIGPGQSFLDSVCAALRIDPIEGFLLLDATQLDSAQLQPLQHTFLVQVYSPGIASDVKLSLMDVYPDDYPVTVVRAAGVTGQERVQQVPLHELDRLDWIDHLTTVYLPPGPGTRAEYRDPWYLAQTVRVLREPGGCPWDRKQTHRTLRQYVLEEAYEVADAIDNDDMFALCDELGDILLQVLLHAQIASEHGDFTLRDVYEALTDKLIHRHPHVFGEDRAENAQDANEFWAKAKQSETPDAREESLMDKVKWANHPMNVAFNIQDKAASIGFDWESIDGVLDKVGEELRELTTEIVRQPRSDDRIQDEFGDVLFTIINLARWLNLNVEEALKTANQKFSERFRIVEQKLKENPTVIANKGASELEEYWNQAKKAEKPATNSLD